MNLRLDTKLSLILMLVFIAGCNKSYSASKIVPQAALQQIQAMEEFSSALTEWVPSVITSTMIVKNAAVNKGTVGDICRAIAIVKPSLEVATREDDRLRDNGAYSSQATIVARNHLINIGETIKCELISLP